MIIQLHKPFITYSDVTPIKIPTTYCIQQFKSLRVVIVMQFVDSTEYLNISETADVKTSNFVFINNY